MRRALDLDDPDMTLAADADILEGGAHKFPPRAISEPRYWPAAGARALTAMGKPIDASALVTLATLPEASWPTIDLVVETVTEDLALKQKLFAEMDTLSKPHPALTPTPPRCALS